ncbi:hypothetical protein CC86DRAFT_90611 [Ophiobolus disseminans]|uniref:F-box domain-containing protein n=1 Tax=Ophiobolus disseminans TaxID=1469910 RepID=A0A6A7AH86_9PLEO|nr:hypothetical protein CC86DRAFT_90611 [Ophiobolus disseminans]
METSKKKDPILASAEPKVGFLDLPGELRNEVYGYLIANVAAKQNKEMVPIALSSKRIARDSIHWRCLSRQDLGFTQICRQVREEYLPFYTRNIKVSILPNETDVENALTGIARPINPSGTVTIRSDPEHPIWREGLQVKVTSLLRSSEQHLKCWPNFYVDENATHILNVMRNFHNNTTWSAVFDEEVHSVSLRSRTSNSPTKVIVTVKFTHAEWWMWHEREPPKRPKRER